MSSRHGVDSRFGVDTRKVRTPKTRSTRSARAELLLSSSSHRLRSSPGKFCCRALEMTAALAMDTPSRMSAVRLVEMSDFTVTCPRLRMPPDKFRRLSWRSACSLVVPLIVVVRTSSGAAPRLSSSSWAL
eukprot:scaffold98240_cov66-Phaeocystis_antarctica.AAC.3